MKIYFNSTFIEKERITDDLWVKGNNGNRIEAYFDDLDLSNTNITARIVIGWSNGETSNEIPLNKNFKNDFLYINLPELKYSGETEFTIKIYQNNYLFQTTKFSRNVKESVTANDETNITSTEYNALLNQIDAVNQNLVENANYNEQMFETFRGDINSSNDSIKALDDSIKAVDNKTTLLEGTINSTREVVNGLENRVANVEYEIELIKEQGVSNPDQDVDVEALKTRVSNVEKNVQTLDNELQIVQDAYIKSVSYNIQSGIFTFTKQDGTIFEVDLAIEKVVTNFTYNKNANALELTLADGTVQSVPMSDFAKAFEGVENDQIQVIVQSGNKIQAILKDNSVGLEKLDENVKNKITAFEQGLNSLDDRIITLEQNQGSGGATAYTTELAVISEWSALESSEEPYTHFANVMLSKVSDLSESIELMNNQPILFAKHGFAIAGAYLGELEIYSIGKPEENVTLYFEIRKNYRVYNGEYIEE